MSAIPLGTLEFVLLGLSATPDILRVLIEKVGAESGGWDTRLDPERFTAREALAHLADWEKVFGTRIEQTRSGSSETLLNVDPFSLRESNHYSSVLPEQALARFRKARQTNLEGFEKLTTEEWCFVGHHPNRGPMTLEVQAVHMFAHDGYHVKQLLDLFGLSKTD